MTNPKKRILDKVVIAVGWISLIPAVYVLYLTWNIPFAQDTGVGSFLRDPSFRGLLVTIAFLIGSNVLTLIPLSAGIYTFFRKRNLNGLTITIVSLIIFVGVSIPHLFPKSSTTSNTPAELAPSDSIASPDTGSTSTPATKTVSSGSNFIELKLPRGIQLHVPKGWWLIGNDYNQVIQTSAEAAMDLSGIAHNNDRKINLIAANSMPRSTYASVRIDSSAPPQINALEVAAATSADLKEIGNEIRSGLEEILLHQGERLLEFHGTHKGRIGSYPVIVTEYRRTGPKGPVVVQTNQIYTESQEININLSYRESETGFWKPVVGKIRQSIVVNKWP